MLVVFNVKVFGLIPSSELGGVFQQNVVVLLAAQG